MEFFTVDGMWWLPASPEHQLPGTLSFDADSLELVVHGSLEPATATSSGVSLFPTEWSTTPVIFGRTHEGKDVTLLDAGGANFVGPDVTKSSYRVGMALTGSHTSDRFVEAWCQFDYLNAWSQPPPVTESGGRSHEYTLRFHNVDLAEAQLEGAEVRLTANVTGRIKRDEVTCKQLAYFVVAFDPSSTSDVLGNWVRPLQDLLILALGKPVRLTELHLRSESTGKLNEAAFEAVQPAPSRRDPDWASIAGNSAPTLLTLRDTPIPFADLLPRWFDLRSKFSEVLVLLHSPHYVGSMFSEHRYSSAFQSAEALAHVLGYSGREKSRAEHRTRVDRLILAAQSAGLNEDSVSWAGRVLRSRNDKPLSKQIHDLVVSTGRIGQEILGTSADFGQITASARTGVSHGGASKSLGVVERHWYGEVLRWVVRAKVLMELGMREGEIEDRVLGRASFRHAIRNLGEQSSTAV
ncbi:hypothetical protein KBX06_00455 [Micromonospora sp. C31]|uniref:ApeA N-terminal domain 1-containing protein n=1 Tax=Micromonospora sp. C31 TaxID=2824876 RepID=UPI001B392027|nr:HEPN domain-containing protein [Micromonospora sp. C31]MBQ1071643.1 hypothetical protein [Micromonospora sp. C31]